jgi:hypothetical protein
LKNILRRTYRASENFTLIIILLNLKFPSSHQSVLILRWMRKEEGYRTMAFDLRRRNRK